MAKLKNLWFDFVDLVFPRCCAACNGSLLGNEETICTVCRMVLPRIEKNGVYAEDIQYRFAGIPEVLSTQSFLLFTKRGKAQKLLHALKYRGNKDVGLLLGFMFGKELIQEAQLPVAELIVSVPLHKRKLAKRGYNQSDLLAEGLSQATGIPWSATALTRNKFTETQTGKSKQERRDNVAGVFGVEPGLRCDSVIVIDDVLTTGATLSACVETLREAGFKEFHILTIAVAQH
ncbi:MAG TPA: ComF family protein [Dyadobacter sp.]|jgi:ComF family protein|nr:ComF family protein [Dyadobacter sp.]